MDKHHIDNVIRRALLRTDPEGIELLWERYASDLLAYLRSVLCSGHDADDVLQIVFVRIVRKRRRLAQARCLDAYMYRIARNEAFRWIRRHKRDKVATEVDDPWLTGSESRDDSEDWTEPLQAALGRLPQSQREVIVMKIYRQKTFQDIARFLGLPQGTVTSRYRYGMEKLRTLLGKSAL